MLPRSATLSRIWMQRTARNRRPEQGTLRGRERATTITTITTMTIQEGGEKKKKRRDADEKFFAKPIPVRIFVRPVALEIETRAALACFSLTGT